jgi:sRNA-binding protein
MTSKPDPASATIEALAGLFPTAFFVHQARRKPLKINIHLDLIAALNGAATVKEIALALAIYTSNHRYLHACAKVGTPRVDLAGNVVGVIDAQAAAHAQQRIEQQRGKHQRRREALAKAKAAAEAKERNAGRISLAELRAAAQARRAAA